MFPLSIFLHSYQDCFAKQYTGTYTIFSGSTFWRTHAQKMDNKYGLMKASLVLSSLQFSHSVISDSLRPHVLQHARPPCPSPTPELPKLMFIELVMPSNHLILCCPLLLLPSIFPRLGSFQMSQLFASGGQSIGVSASAPVLPMNTQD